MKAKLIFVGLLIVLSVSCRKQRFTFPVIDAPSLEGSLMYANEFGALRFMKPNYESGRIVDIGILPFGDVGFGDTLSFGTVFSEYGGIVRSRPGTFDISPFTDQIAPYATAVLTQKNNLNSNDDHKLQSVFQWVGVTKNQRSQILFHNSTINSGLRLPLVNFNYYVRGQSVQFINNSSYLVFFSDYWYPDIGKVRPNFLSTDGFVHYLLKYDFNAPDPYVGEVVAGFSSTRISNAQVFVSAKKNFYALFSPHYEYGPLSPHIIRASDNSYAYTPDGKGAQGYARAPGHESFAFDAHPTKDSLYAVSDNRFGTLILELPQSHNQEFKIVQSFPHSDLAPYVPVYEVFREHAWTIRFNHLGTKLALAYNITSLDRPAFTIWDIATNTKKTYPIPNVGSTVMTKIGRPGWDSASPDGRFVFAWASNHLTRECFLFYVDTDAPAGNARLVQWEQFRYNSTTLNPNAERLRSASEIVQKKPTVL